MVMNKLIFAALVLLMIGVSSCETDIDVNAEYKDIPVVYGMINPEDTVHYIKINKAFLGEGNALDLAANANNFNYAIGELDVVVEEYNKDNLVKSYVLIRTENEIPKVPGIFDNSTNVLYKFIEPSINRNNTYKLKIYNKVLNKEITAETSIVKGTVVSDPVNPGQKFQFWIGTLSAGNTNNKNISVTTGANVGRVNAKLIFNYVEYYTIASGLDSVHKKVIMPIGETKTTTSLGNESLAWELKGDAFFENIVKNVPANVPFLSHRELSNISLEFSVAGNELSTFMEVSAPSNSVNQDKPSYTNINNGIGIFSSRENYIWLSSVNPATGNVNISDNTITKLQSLGLDFCFGSSITSSYKCTQQ